jgi:predicted RNA binding protein YcfA (HicA-like mRNA interferase family)
MTRLPALRPKDVIAALGRAGFETVRVRGSHYQLHNPSSNEPDGSRWNPPSR